MVFVASSYRFKLLVPTRAKQKCFLQFFIVTTEVMEVKNISLSLCQEIVPVCPCLKTASFNDIRRRCAAMKPKTPI